MLLNNEKLIHCIDAVNEHFNIIYFLRKRKLFYIGRCKENIMKWLNFYLKIKLIFNTEILLFYSFLNIYNCKDWQISSRLFR